MRGSKEILQLAKQVLEQEAQALLDMRSAINDDFYQALELIHQSKGRVVISGIGKSAIIAQKIVATLNSTGTPGIFMHAADAVHGDLGIVQQEDVVICISNSGNSPEIKVLIPLLKAAGNVIIGMTGNRESVLAQQANTVLDTTVSSEACPHNLAPTTSTTAQLAMGDALAVCLLQLREFTPQDFARYHPGGALGKRLYLRVEDVLNPEQRPEVAPDADLQTTILEISSKRLGATAVIQNGEILGIITDGDLRRMLSRSPDLCAVKAADIMTENPMTIEHDALAVRALRIIRENKMHQLLVTNNNRYVGMVHIHELNREGLI